MSSFRACLSKSRSTPHNKRLIAELHAKLRRLTCGTAVTRDAQGRISLITTTLTNGFQHLMTPVRDALSGKMTGVTVQVKDTLGTVVYNVTKTLIYTNGKYSGV
jgi:hypothetical protein